MSPVGFCYKQRTVSIHARPMLTHKHTFCLLPKEAAGFLRGCCHFAWRVLSQWPGRGTGGHMGGAQDQCSLHNVYRGESPLTGHLSNACALLLENTVIDNFFSIISIYQHSLDKGCFKYCHHTFYLIAISLFVHLLTSLITGHSAQ